MTSVLHSNNLSIHFSRDSRQECCPAPPASSLHGGFFVWVNACGKKVTKFGGHKKERLCKCLIISNIQSLSCAPGGNRTRTAVSGQGIFVPLWLSPSGVPLGEPVWGLDYSFTIGPGPLGVSCLVSAPSSCRRLGSRLPSA